MDDTPLQIQLISDVHLELMPNAKNVKIGDLIDPPMEGPHDLSPKGKTVLVLAGDIGDPFSVSYSTFLRSCIDKYYHVVIVAGNHEFYNSRPMNFVIQKIRQVVEELDATRIHFLNVDGPSTENIREKISVVIDGVKFIGTTLWSDISGTKRTRKGFNGRYYTCATINDFSVINKMSRERYQQLHLLHKARLKEEIENSIIEYNKIVVITHHLPTYELIADEYKESSQINHFYASDCSDLIFSLSEVINIDGRAVWLCGHSHHSKHITIKGVDLYLNPLGYKGEKTGYTSEVILL